MTRISIICLIAGCVQFVIGLVLSASSLGMVLFGVSPGVSFGLGLVLSGMLTLVAGLVTGIHGWRARKEGALAAILNIAVTGFLLLLIVVGVLVQQAQRRRSAEALRKYEAERADERNQAATATYEDFHRALWAHKVVLLTAGKISKAMGALAVGGYQVVTVPEIDRAIDPVNAVLLGRTEPNLLRLVKELLNAGVQADLLALQAFARANGTSCRVGLHGDYPDLMDANFSLLAAKAEVIAAIDKVLME